jgi:hypothetical protein
LLAVPALYMEAGPGAFAVATALGVVHAVDSSFSWRSLVPPWYNNLYSERRTVPVLLKHQSWNF